MTAAMKPWPGRDDRVLERSPAASRIEQEQDQEPRRVHADADAADPEELQ